MSYPGAKKGPTGELMINWVDESFMGLGAVPPKYVCLKYPGPGIFEILDMFKRRNALWEN